MELTDTMPPPVQLLPAALFFFSGCASLIFETLCSRKLALVIGSTVQSASATVSAFLLGLGVGAHLGGKLAARSKRPLLAFALLEGVAGIGALVVLYLIPLLPELLVPVARSAPQTLLFVKVVSVVLLLLLPAIAMGASLPVLSHYYVENLRRHFTASLAFLYAVNTLGAAAGVLVTDFFLVERLGVVRTGWVSCVLYLLVAVLALLLARTKTSDEPPERPETEPSNAARGSVRVGFLVLVASGFCGLTFQVLWTRMLTFFNGNDVFAFSTTLAVYLIGLVVGSALAGVFGRRTVRLELTLGVLLTVLGLTAYLSLFSVELVRSFREVLEGQNIDFGTLVFLCSGLVMLPSATCLGVLFPLAAEKIRESDPVTGTVVGRAYLFNTAGSVLGALLAGFLMLPVLGLQKSLAITAGFTVLLGAGVLYRGLARPALALIWPLVFVVILVATPKDFLLKTFYGPQYEDIVFSVDDHYGSIALTKGWDDDLKQVVENLLVDGFNMAGNTVNAKRYTTGLAALPILLHDNPKSGLIVCMGLGNTLNTALSLEPMESVQCVELSTQIPKALAKTDIGPKVLSDPKLSIEFGDGRNHLLNTTQTYDIISAEPPPPTHAGIVNLYSKEYYELCSDRLNEEGIVVQWLPVFQLTAFEAKTIIKAFQEVFPYTYLWESAGEQLCLIGRKDKPLDLDFEELKSSVEQNADFLAATGWDNPELIAALAIAGPEDLLEYTSGIPPLTDDWPIIQYSDKQWGVDRQFFFFNERPPALDWQATPEQTQRIAGLRTAIQAFHLYAANRDPRYSKLAMLERHDLAGFSLELLPDDTFFQTRYLTIPARLAFFREQALKEPSDPRNHFEVARIEFINGNLNEALAALQPALSLPSSSQEFYKLYELLIRFRMGQEEEVATEFAELNPTPSAESEYLGRLVSRYRLENPAARAR